MNPKNHNCAIIVEELNGLFHVVEYGWTRESPYDQPGTKPFIRSRGSYATHSRACDEADWVNHPELRKERT